MLDIKRTIYDEVIAGNLIPFTLKYTGLTEFKRCSWCNNIVKKTDPAFCCSECEEEARDWYELKRIKDNRECAKRQYAKIRAKKVEQGTLKEKNQIIL